MRNFRLLPLLGKVLPTEAQGEGRLGPALRSRCKFWHGGTKGELAEIADALTRARGAALELLPFLQQLADAIKGGRGRRFEADF